MKCTTFIDKSREEEVIIYAHGRTSLCDDIEALVLQSSNELFGYSERNIVRLSPGDVFCFLSEGGKVFALTESGRYRIKSRLYEIEEQLPHGFVRINQSSIVNISQIKKFSVCIAGSLSVELKCGYKDYVSRRQLKAVKEKIGIKK